MDNIDTMPIPPVDNRALPITACSRTMLRRMLREAVIAARDKKRWTTNKLAVTAGVPQSRVHEWLEGGRTIHSDHLDKLLAALGLTVKPSKRKPKP